MVKREGKLLPYLNGSSREDDSVVGLDLLHGLRDLCLAALDYVALHESGFSVSS
jgi:hypothetical protein